MFIETKRDVLRIFNIPQRIIDASEEEWTYIGVVPDTLRQIVCECVCTNLVAMDGYRIASTDRSKHMLFWGRCICGKIYWSRSKSA